MIRLSAAIASLGILIHLAACERVPDAEPSEVMPEVWMAQGALQDVERMDVDGASVEGGMRVVVGTHACSDASSCYSCYQCHGIRGEGSSVANFPRLTAQSYVYLYQSLQDFAASRRPNPTMREVVRGLSDEQMRDVAAYYSAVRPALPILTGPPLESSAAEADTGRRIALEGSRDRVVQACAECHGAESSAPALPAYPNLAGQHAGYIASQLNAFGAGTREDPTQIMNHIASQLTESEIRAVAQYYSSLQPAVAAERTGAGSPGSL